MTQQIGCQRFNRQMQVLLDVLSAAPLGLNDSFVPGAMPQADVESTRLGLNSMTPHLQRHTESGRVKLQNQGINIPSLSMSAGQVPHPRSLQAVLQLSCVEKQTQYFTIHETIGFTSNI